MEEDEHRRQQEAYQSAGAGDGSEPPTPEELMELQLRLTKFPGLDSKALTALNSLVARDAIKALKELEAKGNEIRNPSAWICRTAQNLREKQKQKVPPPPPQEEEQGSAPHLDIVDYYAALEVADDADEATIKKAYRKLVLKWHPDKHPEDRDQADDRIRAINNAYETLSNATKRSTYDAQRKALERQKKGFGPDQAVKLAPRQRIPREFMLQPIGFPDKFVRYAAEKARASCFVNSRADARSEGKSGLEQFVPFFKAAKLSLWWLPEVNNMCRIRSLEARTRSSAGEKVVAGRPGGLNLGFEIELDNMGRTDSDLRLMEAGKGERNECVNFIVVPSPLYDGAFRFEGAYRRGYFLAFRPPTHLRMVPYNGGAIPAKTVIDFTLVDFQAMFKFIDVEEVLRPVIEQHPGWVALEQVKRDPNVVAYFGNILQKPIWDDEDFQMYFEGHYETWEFKCEAGLPMVRLRGVDERLGYALDRTRDSDVAASLIVSAGEEVRRLPWRYAAAAFEALSKPGAEDVSALVQRVEAHRRLLSSLNVALVAAAEEASLTELGRLAEALKVVATEGAAPDLQLRGTDAMHSLGKVVLARIVASERGGLGAKIRLDDVGSLLALPGVGAHGDALARHTSPSLTDAPLKSLLSAVSTAQAADAPAFAREAAQAALLLVAQPHTSPVEAAHAVRTIAASGVLLDHAAAALGRRAQAMETNDLATAIVALGDKSCEGHDLRAACQELATRKQNLERLPAVGLLALAVAATKTTSMIPCAGAVVDAAVHTLSSWPVGEAIKLLLAVVKAKGAAISPETLSVLVREATAKIAPALGELPAAELVRLGLAAGTDVGGQVAASGLLGEVAKEACRRLSDLPQAHLLLLTQGLAPLGGRNVALRQICDFWGELFSDNGSSGPGDEVSKRRKDMERGQALSAEHLAKLSSVLEPVAQELDDETQHRCLSGLGARLLATASSLSAATQQSLLEQVMRGEGVGRWEAGRDRLARALQRNQGGSAGDDGRGRSSRRSRSDDRKRRRRSSSSRGRKRSSSRSRGRRRRSSSSSSSSSRGTKRAKRR